MTTYVFVPAALSRDGNMDVRVEHFLIRASLSGLAWQVEEGSGEGILRMRSIRIHHTFLSNFILMRSFYI